MKKEYVLLTIVGLFLFSYVLDAAVNPLNIPLKTPYHFLNLKYITTYPFTTLSIAVKSVAIFLTPLLFMSFFEKAYNAKATVLLVLVALMQLFSLQDLATKARIVPLEWSLSLSIAGIGLLAPTVVFYLMGGLSWIHQSLGGKDSTEEDQTSEDSEEEGKES